MINNEKGPLFEDIYFTALLKWSIMIYARIIVVHGFPWDWTVDLRRQCLAPPWWVTSVPRPSASSATSSDRWSDPSSDSASSSLVTAGAPASAARAAARSAVLCYAAGDAGRSGCDRVAQPARSYLRVSLLGSQRQRSEQQHDAPKTADQLQHTCSSIKDRWKSILKYAIFAWSCTCTAIK
jgi:hypothetical protein